jgi:hypothetical protein
MILSQTREKMANEQENFSLPQNQYHCSRIQGKFLLFFIFWVNYQFNTLFSLAVE